MIALCGTQFSQCRRKKIGYPDLNSCIVSILKTDAARFITAAAFLWPTFERSKLRFSGTFLYRNCVSRTAQSRELNN